MTMRAITLYKAVHHTSANTGLVDSSKGHGRQEPCMGMLEI